MSCGLARFNDGPGWFSDERGRPLRGYYKFHVKQNNYLSPVHVILTVYIVFNIVHCAKSVSSVILAQFINTILSSAIIGLDCYEYH